MIKKIFSILFVLILTVFSNTAFWDDITSNTGSETDSIFITDNQSIKEMKSWLIELTKNQNELNVEFFVLNQNQKLKEFFRDDLLRSEVNVIENIINNYLEAKKEIETNIKIKALALFNTENERSKLLYAKKEFYKSLTPYIKKYKINEYLEYITQDVKILKEKWELSEKLIVQNEIIVNKVEAIEWRIKEYREYLNEKFNSLINDIIGEKINTLINNEKFLKLNLESKELVINKILIRIQITISNLEKKFDKTEALIKKLEIYKKVYQKLEEIKNNLI